MSKKARGENVWSKVNSQQCPVLLRPGPRRTGQCRWLTETTDKVNRTENVAGLGQEGKKQDVERRGSWGPDPHLKSLSRLA